MPQDWLVLPFGEHSRLSRHGTSEIALENGLIRRTFRLAPNCATVGLDNLMSGEAMLRAVKPEAMVEIDGKKYSVGGLIGQPNLAFLRPDWLEKMTADSDAFQFRNFNVGIPEEPVQWRHSRSNTTIQACLALKF